MRKQNWEIAPRLTSHDEQLIGMRRFRNIAEGNQDKPSIYEWVDLGLPSGLLWASTNVGAEKPEDFGLYFAWGETKGYTQQDVQDKIRQFDWANYELCDGDQYKLNKYCTIDGFGTVDNLTTLELIDDIAYKNNNSCRIPTEADFEELLQHTEVSYEPLNNVNGVRLTSKINGNSIFIPSAGWSYGKDYFIAVGEQFYLWSSEIDREWPSSAHALQGMTGPYYYEFGMNATGRNYACNIRAIINQV